MTEGQQLAIEQLRAVEQKSDGAFDIAEILEPTGSLGSLSVLVSIDCSGKEPKEGGVRLRRREWFMIFVPPDFPYSRPETFVRHTRFAGLPHVQWKRYLCLYQAPTTEWNVNDGMFGYLNRLDIWLDHAAAGQLNPSGEPLHPPVAYVTDGPVRTVIPRADAPAVGDANWIGFAQLSKVSEIRADVTGWTPFEGMYEGTDLAPAFLLSEPMPFEFPKTMADLFVEMGGRHISVNLVVSVLRYAVLLNGEGKPLFVVLGTPMRGVAGSRDLKYHLAAWYVPAELVEGLRLSLNRFASDPRLQELGAEVEHIVIEWLSKTDVEWCLVREDRPEIVVPRDRDSAAAWFKGKSVALWGCGALGSHAAEFLARAGVRRLALWDNGVVTPGLLARQLFTDDDIGKSKVSVVASRLKAIRPTLEVEEHFKNVLSGPLASDDWTGGADVVIETTGAGAIISKFEAVRRPSKRRVPFVSMAIGHTAERAELLIAGAAHSGGTLDVDRKLRQECYRRPDLRDYTEEFWPHEPRTAIFQPEPGCSDATFTGSCADVALLAASLLNMTARELREAAAPAVAHLLLQPALPGRRSPAHQRFSWPEDQILEDPSSGYEIRLASSAGSELGGWVEANDRLRGVAVETGGLLFGERSDLLKIVWVDEISGPPPDSTHSAAGFVCGTQGTAELALEKSRRTHGLLGFLGMWHTHPGGLPLPSGTDLRAIRQLVEATGSPQGKSVMLIVGGLEAEGITAAAGYVFSAEEFNRIAREDATRTCSIHVTKASHKTRNVGLALSGGGSRAIAFHLGCVRALHDRGILDRLQVISSVSGGSVVGAMYAYSKGTFREFEESVLKLLRRGLQRDIILRLADPRFVVRTAATIGVAGSAAAAANLAGLAIRSVSSTLGIRTPGVISATKKLQPPARRWAGATVAFEDVLRKRVFGDTRLKEPRRADFDVVLNACELRSGTAFRFGSRESGCWRYGTIADNEASVAHAVAASAAYPALLPAIDDVIDFVDRKGAQHRRRVLLTDGGVYDNLGVTCLEPGSATEVGYNRFTPDYIICCDAGQGILQDYPVPYLWGPRMVRAFESVFRKAQNGTQNRLHLLAETGKIKGFVMPYLGQIDERLPYPPADLVKREEVFEYPTDFGPMKESDINRIATRGYQLTRTLLAYYCPEL